MKLYDSIYQKLNVQKDSLIFDLVKNPKDKDLLHHKAYDENATHQADLLFLPNDNGYKYCLSVIDVATRKADGEAIKDKQPKTILKAMKKIWSRGVLSKPTLFLKTDDGTEFKGEMAQYLKDNGIIHQVGKAGRSRSQAVVESLNLLIGRSLMIKQRNDEIATGEFNTEWRDDLPIIIDTYNQFVKEKEEKREAQDKPTRKEEMYEDMTIEVPDKVYEIGQKVFIPLDKPENFKGKRLKGNFRAGDLRHEVESRKITDILIGDPTVYRVEGVPNAVYTYEMLLKDTGKSKPKPTKDKYEVEKIVNKRKVNNRVEYLVKWKNYNNTFNQWIKRTQLINQVPDLIAEYEES